MRGDTNGEIKNVSSLGLKILSSSLSTETNKNVEENCRSSSSSSSVKLNKYEKDNKKIDDSSLESESTDYITGNSSNSTNSNKNDLVILIDKIQSLDNSSSRTINSENDISSISNSSKSQANSSSSTITKNISKSLSESISDTLISNDLSNCSSSKKLLNTSTSLYTTADDCSCKSECSDSNCKNQISNLICCSRSSCLITNCTCCSTNINYLNSNRFRNQSKLIIELDETEYIDNSNLNYDNSSSFSDETTTTQNLNDVNSEDQSTYNQHTYTITEEDDDDLQSKTLTSNLRLTKLNELNELIELTNHSNQTTNQSNNINLINQIEQYDNQQSTNTISELNNYERLSCYTTTTTSSDKQISNLINKLNNESTIRSTISSPINNDEISSLIQLSKSINKTSNSHTKQQTDNLKSSDSSIFNQSTDNQLIKFEDSTLIQQPIQQNEQNQQKQDSNFDSAKLITMNLEENEELELDDLTDDLTDEKIKQNQLHLNTLSELSMLSFPEVEENVDTYQQHASTRCLLNCSPNKCSSKNHNDLIDETNTFNDLNLMKDLSDLNSSSVAQIKFDDYDDDYDDQLMKYNDPTINSHDHSSELDSELDAEFDQDDDLICLDRDQDTELLLSNNNLTTDICANHENNNAFEYDNNDNNLNNNDNAINIKEQPPYRTKLIDLSKLSTDDFVILNNTNFDKFEGNFKEEASIVLKNKASTPVNNTCLAKTEELNGTNDSTKTNGTNLNGNSVKNDTAKTNGTTNGHSTVIKNDVDSKQLNGHSKIDTVKVDTSKAQKKFSQDTNEEDNCGICNKTVFQVEKIKAEKKIYHKNCFRCIDCRKQLSMDNYNSHKGQLYCQVHFKLLLRPKPVESIGDDYLSRRQRKMIIRESTPTETPPGVIRSDSKLDDGLDNIQLDLSNLKQRFENGHQSSDENSRPNSKAERNQLQRSESILQKVNRYQSIASGIKMANSDSESASNSAHNSDTEQDLVKEDLNYKEKVNFNGLNAIKNQFENGSLKNGNSSDDGSTTNGSVKDGRDDETKKELYKLRQRMCLGRSASMKQVYENQVKEANSNQTNGKSSNTNSLERPRINTNSMKEKFEKGEFTTENEIEFKEKLRREVDEELNVVHESETAAKDAKNKFKQLEKSNSFQQHHNSINNLKSQQNTPRSTPTHHIKTTTAIKNTDDKPIEIIKCSEPGQKEEVHINVNQLQERYRFFEQQMNNSDENKKQTSVIETPRRPIQLPKASDDDCIVETPNDKIVRDPNIIRSSDIIDDLPKDNVAKKMLNMFQQLEKTNSTPVTKELNGAQQRPAKRCITPPKDFTVDNNEDETDAVTNGHEDKDIVRSSYKDDSIIPVEPEKAKSLKAKFENWANLVENENRKNSNLTESIEEIPVSDITKNLRSKFESFKEDKQPEETKVSKVKVNRFVFNFSAANTDLCSICSKPLYFVDKIELKSNFKLHKRCFKCSHCFSTLRLENYTYAVGKLYCSAHYYQLFKLKGNYDTSFGASKWQKIESTRSRNSSINSSGNSSERNDTPDQELNDLDEEVFIDY